MKLRRWSSTLVLALSAVALLMAGAVVRAPAATAASDFAVGISDSDDDTFTHPAWAGLGVSLARAVVPWDIAARSDERRAEFDRWLANARAAGVEPFVTMGPSDQVTHAGTCSMRAPTRDEFAAAFDAVRATFGVTVIAVWNEPNFAKECAEGHPRVVTPSGRAFHDPDCPSSPSTDNCGPLAAAFYWRLATAACPDCILPAGEFDSTPDDRYWDQYQTFLRDHRPKLWSIHPYTDGNRFQASGDGSAPATTSFVNALGGTWATAGDGTASHIWLTEVGAYWRNAEEQVFDDTSHRDTTAFILRLPQISDRITRIYYYNFQNEAAAEPCPKQDRGLVAPAGCDYDDASRVRPAYDKLADRDASPGPGPSGEPSPEPSEAPTEAPTAAPSEQPTTEPSQRPAGGGGFDGDPASTERIGQASGTLAAAQISSERFADDAAAHVVLSRDDAFADSLAGASLTADGPLLFTGTDAIPGASRAELDRAVAPGGLVYLLGGEGAISGAVSDELAAAGYQVRRLAGAARVETADAVADEVARLHPQQGVAGLARAYGATDDDPTAAWADSVTGGGWAASTGTPILVTPSDAVHPAVGDWLARHGVARTVLLGGQAALSEDVEAGVPGPQRVAGAERAATAAQIARELWGATDRGTRRFTVVSGYRADGWQYGLAAGGIAADADAPLLVVGDDVPPDTAGLVASCGDPEVDLLLVGGPDVIADSVAAALDGLDGQGSCG